MADPVCSLTVRLEVIEGWPPVAAECLPCMKDKDKYRILSPPFFIKDLSVGDVVEITETDHDQVCAWKHVAKSGRSEKNREKAGVRAKFFLILADTLL